MSLEHRRKIRTNTELTILPTQMLNGAVRKIAYLKERNTQRKEDK